MQGSQARRKMLCLKLISELRFSKYIARRLPCSQRYHFPLGRSSPCPGDSGAERRKGRLGWWGERGCSLQVSREAPEVVGGSSEASGLTRPGRPAQWWSAPSCAGSCFGASDGEGWGVLRATRLPGSQGSPCRRLVWRNESFEASGRCALPSPLLRTLAWWAA